MGYRASVYCNMFFGEQSPGDADLFAILDNVSHNAIMASRRFDFHI